jgi:hypothetical protein
MVSFLHVFFSGINDEEMMMYEKRPLEKTLDELIEEIADFPQNMFPVAESKYRQFAKKGKKKSGSSLNRQGCLDELRLCLKYLLFDLDATHRENAYLKRLLNKEQ